LFRRIQSGTRTSGYDAGKKIKGAKRHIAVDTLGLMHGLVVTPASIQDRDMIAPLMTVVRSMCATIQKSLADGGYQGAATAAEVLALAGIPLEIVKRSHAAKGFVLLNWGHGGWTQVFTKKPVTTVAEMKQVKLWTSAGNDRMVQWFKANGFDPRAMAMTDITTGLTTGMIDGLPTTPLAASLFQWYRQTPVHARARPRADRRRGRDHDQGVEGNSRGRPADAAHRRRRRREAAADRSAEA
jgi:hypothetical protein